MIKRSIVQNEYFTSGSSEGTRILQTKVAESKEHSQGDDYDVMDAGFVDKKVSFNSESYKEKDSNNNPKSSIVSVKYALRPRIRANRLRKSESKELLSRTARTKSAPLSKYRRKTANARERHRMKEINLAFETLRKIVPGVANDDIQSTPTKIVTLRSAVKYIQTLMDMLEECDELVSYNVPTSQYLSSIPALHREFSDHLSKVATEDDSAIGMWPTHSCLQGKISLRASALNSPLEVSSPFSGSDLDDLLSDKSVILEGHLDLFQSISSISDIDPLDLFQS